ncbi:MAG: hypothetical protein M3463_08710, partial [Verrucomicrobiota bacterium]|nr:hypothetical protein [Verrucomicrobiota bacterium]
GRAAAVRALATAPAEFAQVSRLFENRLAQAPDEAPLLGETLAGLYVEWAERELLEGQSQPALGHLRRAHELRPGLFAAAQNLAALYVAQSQHELAREVLERFLASTADAAQKEKARQLLARLRPGPA